MVLDLIELQAQGWTVVEDINTEGALLDLGHYIGTPVHTPNGELVKKIRRQSKDTAPPRSQSSLYGEGPFPLHTDTVFWPLPVRYILLRGYGDTRRQTTIQSFKDLLSNCDKTIQTKLKESVWQVIAGPKPFYCSLYFHHGHEFGWRYDFDLMTPANAAAKYINDILKPLAAADGIPGIEWSGDQAVILDNWHVLHGRGPQPPNEGIRIIERLYVNKL